MATKRCDPYSHSCVACFNDSQCGLAATARCDLPTHACAACNDSSQCAHIAGKNVCATEGCVECTHEERDACDGGANVCDSTTHTCTARPERTRDLCDECVSDDDCITGSVCIPMIFASTSAPLGNFCLFRESASSAGAPNGNCLNLRAYTYSRVRTTVDGEMGVAACHPNSATTCAALHDYRTRTCSGETLDGDRECGAPGIDDGYCRSVDERTNQCTFPCGATSDCKTGATCNDIGRCVW